MIRHGKQCTNPCTAATCSLLLGAVVVLCLLLLLSLGQNRSYGASIYSSLPTAQSHPTYYTPVLGNVHDAPLPETNTEESRKNDSLPEEEKQERQEEEQKSKDENFSPLHCCDNFLHHNSSSVRLAVSAYRRKSLPIIIAEQPFMPPKGYTA